MMSFTKPQPRPGYIDARRDDGCTPVITSAKQVESVCDHTHGRLFALEGGLVRCSGCGKAFHLKPIEPPS